MDTLGLVVSGGSQRCPKSLLDLEFFALAFRHFFMTCWCLPRALRHPALSAVIDEGRGILGFTYIGNRWASCVVCWSFGFEFFVFVFWLGDASARAASSCGG